MHADPIGRRAFHRSLILSIAARLAGRTDAQEATNNPHSTGHRGCSGRRRRRGEEVVGMITPYRPL